METAPASGHRWQFARVGGFDQVRLETADDIRHLGELDQKLWAALSCPVNGLEFDQTTLRLLDTDEDDRIRVQEILAASQWCCEVLADMEPFMAGAAELPLAAINEESPDGRVLLASARQLLAYLGKPDADRIAMEDVADTNTLLANARFNGDGIVTPATAEDARLAGLIEEVMACVGSDPDRSGLPGISRERLEAFSTAAHAFADWWEETDRDPAILPVREQGMASAESYLAVKDKIDDYFTRCGLAAYDARAEEALNPAPTAYEALEGLRLSSISPEMAQFPLAYVKAGQPLSLRQGVNPAWAAALERFADLVVTPLIGASSILEAGQWQQIKAAFASYEDWKAREVGVEVEQLGIDRVRAILQGQECAALERLIQEDLRLEEQVRSIDQVVRLMHYNRDLFHLLNNFVAFRDFYQPGNTAIFQAGTLYIDGRACDLCIRVEDTDSHSALAGLSQTYLAYCDCTRKNSDEKMVIAAALTSGDSDYLMVGRNGVFYDRSGQDWDARIIKLLDHPISVSQAFWSPYKRMARMVSEQIEKFASVKDKSFEAKAGSAIADTGSRLDAGTPPAAPAPFDVGKFAGIFAAMGLAIGAIGTALASIMTGFLTLPLWQMPLVLAGIVLAISGPSMLLAYMKLRKRNLGPLLDANGWAVNSRAMINIPFGATLTRTAVLPKGAARSLTDPFRQKKTPWKRWVFLAVLLFAAAFAWDKGYVQKWITQLKGQVTRQAEQGKVAPAAPAVPAKETAPKQ